MSEHEKATPRPWRARWEDVEQQYNRFCEAERAKGTLWQDIPNCTQWFLDSYDASRVLIEQMRDALKAEALEEVFQWLLDEPHPDSEFAAMTKRMRDAMWSIRSALAAAEKFLKEGQ